jgi:hypothetical protein
MIFFVPAYDPGTHDNLLMVQCITTDSSLKLFGAQATKDALERELKHSTSPLFTMSHGDADQLKAQEGQTALSEENIHLLKERAVYAFACNTAIQLGESAAQKGSTWWGYCCPISCAPDSPYVRSLFANLFIFIRDHFHTAVSPQQKQTMLEELRKRCEEAFHKELPDCYIGTSLEPNLQEYRTLIEIWNRLRVWSPGTPQAEKHPSASEPAIYYI